MILCDFHVHSNFSDGNSSVEEIIKNAIASGMTKIGISDHCYTFFDDSYCIQKNRQTEYFETVNQLKEKYAESIQVLCGIEQDAFAQKAPFDFDYQIGSVHYILKQGEYIPVDAEPEILVDAANRLFDGDFYALCENYFESVAHLFDMVDADIIGHFDLISKFNENGELYDFDNPRYIAAWQKAADTLIPYGKPFEINTGAISRGYRTTPYPTGDIVKYIADRGGRFILSSDSHDASTVRFRFLETQEWLSTLEKDHNLSLQIMQNGF